MVAVNAFEFSYAKKLLKQQNCEIDPFEWQQL